MEHIFTFVNSHFSFLSLNKQVDFFPLGSHLFLAFPSITKTAASVQGALHTASWFASPHGPRSTWCGLPTARLALGVLTTGQFFVMPRLLSLKLLPGSSDTGTSWYQIHVIYLNLMAFPLSKAVTCHSRVFSAPGYMSQFLKVLLTWPPTPRPTLSLQGLSPSFSRFFWFLSSHFEKLTKIKFCLLKSWLFPYQIFQIPYLYMWFLGTTVRSIYIILIICISSLSLSRPFYILVLGPP